MRTTGAGLLSGLLLFASACGTPQAGPEPSPTASSVADGSVRGEGSASGNPASSHCVQNGGTEKTVSDAEGNQSGVCVFDDGSECESWAFYRDECRPGQINSPTP